MTTEREVLLGLYRTMVRIRAFEKATRKLQKAGSVPGGFGMYTGEEAIAAGVSAHLGPKDYVTSTHRPLGHCVAKGAELKPLMAELCGRVTGFNKGKAGPWHLGDLSCGLLGANGIVGGGPPLAAGAALANQLRKKGGVAVCYFGEGASNQGTVQETMNLAAVWKLPLILMCENSSPEIQISLGHTLNFPQISIKDISIRGRAYGIPGITIDGNDAIAVYEALRKAVTRARKGNGPTLVEAKTYLYEGPFAGPEADKMEETWEKRDPIIRLEKSLREAGRANVKELERIKEEEDKKVDEAVKYALASSEPPIEEAFTDVFNGGA